MIPSKGFSSKTYKSSSSGREWGSQQVVEVLALALLEAAAALFPYV